MRVSDNKHADTDHQYAGPPQRRHGFFQEEITEHGHHGVGKRGSRLNVTVVRPGENQHVGDKKGQQTSDPQPDVARADDTDKNMKEIDQLPVVGLANYLNAFAEQYIGKVAKQ